MDAQTVIDVFNSMSAAIEIEKDRLCELDGAIGDADHGVTMALGFNAVRNSIATLDVASASPTDVFNNAAKAFLNAVGASAGPLYATAFMRAGASVKGKVSLDKSDIAAAIVAMAEGIKARGKAEVGDKTMLDAWVPAAAAAQTEVHNENVSVKQMLQRIADAAEQGAQTTVDLQAKKGRAAKLGERSIGHMDAGAASTAILLGAMANAIPE